MKVEERTWLNSSVTGEGKLLYNLRSAIQKSLKVRLKAKDNCIEDIQGLSVFKFAISTKYLDWIMTISLLRTGQY